MRSTGPGAHLATQRKGREKAAVKGVQFGPRVTDPALKAAAQARKGRLEKQPVVQEEAVEEEEAEDGGKLADRRLVDLSTCELW